METLENKLNRRVSISLYAILFLTMLLGLSVLLEGCVDECHTTNVYTYYAPVYTSLEEIRSAVTVEQPKAIASIGKIYFKGNFLFINEPGKGIHIINNHDPAQPDPVKFIGIPGNYDLAIKGNTLYADSYIDLVLFDIANLDAIQEIKRLENVFSNYNALGFSMDASRGLITDWIEEKDVKVYESDCNASIQPWGGIFFEDGIALQNGAVFDKSAALAPGNGSVPGVGGSMARFTVHRDHLYVLDQGEVQAFDVASETDPVDKGSSYIAWDMETIFPYGDHLFIGSQSGMHILDVKTNPAAPTKISTYQHVRVCDPVVVQDTLAYVTLRSGTQCTGFTNQLEVINIKDVTSPQLLHIYPMHNPHGLGIDDNTLFVCDGDDGLKIFDAADVSVIDQKLLAHHKNINAFDIIPLNGVAMMIGSDGIFQYDYTDPTQVKLLSTIAISK